jgi:hypothetical protein
MLLLALLVGVLNVTTVRHVTAVSAIDEKQDIDYLVKASHLKVDQAGDRPAEQTLIELCTRGGGGYLTFPPCRPGRQDARKFFEGGVVTAGALPLYFFITGLAARSLQTISPKSLPPRDSLVTWGRLLGAVWLLLGCYLTVVAGDLLGVRRRLVVAAIVLAIGTPALLHATTTINPDATAFAAGAGVLLAALAWERRRIGYWVLVVAAVVAAALKMPNTVGIMVAVAFLSVRAIYGRWFANGDERRPVSDYMKAVAVLVLGALAAIKGWNYLDTYLQNHVIGKPDTNTSLNPAAHAATTRYKIGHLGLDNVFGQLTVPQLLPPIDDVAPPAGRLGGIYGTFGVLAKYLLVVPLVGLLLVGRRFRGTLQHLSLAALAALLTTPVLFVLYWYYTGGTNDQIVPRYGLSAMPVLVLLLAAAAARGRVGPWVLGAMALAMYVSAVLTNFV